MTDTSLVTSGPGKTSTFSTNSSSTSRVAPQTVGNRTGDRPASLVSTCSLQVRARLVPARPRPVPACPPVRP
ncbi:hypothetical protein STENM327S_06000 [Streptomyces tendae]